MTTAVQSVATTLPDWPDAPTGLKPGSAEVHILCAPLDVSTSRLHEFTESLSPEELKRAAQFHFAIHRNRFIARRGILRAILGGCLNIAPGNVALAYGPFGKPELLNPSADGQLHFNLAHSQSIAVFAVSAAGRIGVDVELLRPMPDVPQVASTVFSPREQAEWQRLSPPLKLQGFFDRWSQKEAYVKASGRGLGVNPAEIEALPSDLPGWWHVTEQGQVAPDCFLKMLPMTGHSLAVAVERLPANLSCWSWNVD